MINNILCGPHQSVSHNPFEHSLTKENFQFGQSTKVNHNDNSCCIHVGINSHEFYVLVILTSPFFKSFHTQDTKVPNGRPKWGNGKSKYSWIAKTNSDDTPVFSYFMPCLLILAPAIMLPVNYCSNGRYLSFKSLDCNPAGRANVALNFGPEVD